MYGRTYKTHGIYDFGGSRFATSVAPVGVRFRPLPLTVPFEYTSGVYAEINNRDRTRNIDWRSLEVSNILTRQIDSCQFTFKRLTGDDFEVEVNDNVKIYDTQTLIFQGVVTNIRRRFRSAGLLDIDIEAVDYTRELDAGSVYESYTDQTVEFIINDIITRYAPQFTTNNVVAAQVVESITFSYQPISTCLQELADMFGQDWYVDEYKDIHFEDSTNIDAPFDITDTSGNHLQGTLQLNDDNSQIRNVIFLRGGEEIGSSQTFSESADGEKLNYPCGFHFSTTPTVTVAAASKTVGVEGVDDATLFDCLWNPSRDYVLFKTATKPAAADLVEITGTPLNPILLKYPDRDSITEHGERSITVIDKTIITRDGARQRARAELLKYAATLKSGSFVTLTKGLKAGQTINVDSDLFDVDQDYIITELRTTMLSPVQVQYEATLVSTKLMDIVDLLAKMLRSKVKEQAYASNESFDPVEAVFGDITITEALAATTTPDATAADTITTADSTSLAGGTGLDFGTIFVFGPWTPSGLKRQFNFDRSPLG